MELNFVFCEWELCDGTASEKKTKNAKRRINSNVYAAFKIVGLKRVVVNAAPTNLSYNY